MDTLGPTFDVVYFVARIWRPVVWGWEKGMGGLREDEGVEGEVG